MLCILPILLMANMLVPCEGETITGGLIRPYAFKENIIRPMSTAFELDTMAFVRYKDRYQLSLDLWRIPTAGVNRTPTGIDLWSVMIGVRF